MLDENGGARLWRVTGIVKAILAKHDSPRPIGREDDLARLGFTSIDMVELMLAVEGEFDLVIPPDDITSENFRSVSAVDHLVSRLMAQSEEQNVEAA